MSHARTRTPRHPHPLRRRLGPRRSLAALLLAAIALLIAAAARPRRTSSTGPTTAETTIGRAKINGTGVNNAFITGLDQRPTASRSTPSTSTGRRAPARTSSIGAPTSTAPASIRTSSRTPPACQDFDPLRRPAPRSPSTPRRSSGNNTGQWTRSATPTSTAALRPAPSCTTGPDRFVRTRRRPELRLLAGQSAWRQSDRPGARSTAPAARSELHHRRRRRGLRPRRRRELPLLGIDAPRRSGGRRCGGGGGQ